MATMFLVCVCVVVGVTLGQDENTGFFLLAGAAENTVYKLENESFSSVPVSSDIQTMAFDPMSRRIYYGTVFSIHLYSMDLDGTDVRIEATTDLYVQAIAIDSIAGNIFVYSPGHTGKIYRVVMGEDPTLDQSNIIHTDEREVYYMTVDPKTRTLLWGSTTGVWQSNYDGTNKKNMLPVFNYFDGIAVDDRNVYVISNNKILKIDRSLDQTFTEIFGGIRDSSKAKSLVLVGNSLFFGSSACVHRPTTVCNKSIATVHTDGTGFKLLSPVVSSLNYGDTMTLVYVIKSDNKTTTKRTMTTTTTPTKSFTTSSLALAMETTEFPCYERAIKETDIDHSVDGSFLLSGAAERSIYKLVQSGSYSAIPVSNRITALSFDHASNRIFYGVTFELYVYSMRMDGSDVRKEATTDLYVQAIAVDSINQCMFVYSTAKGRIYKVGLGQDWTMDQSNVIHSGQSEVFYITVDTNNRTLIWGEYNGVFLSNYDGSEKKLLFRNTGYVDGVAFDDSSIYVLTDNTLRMLDRSTGIPNVLYSQRSCGNKFHLQGLVEYQDHIYFGKYHCADDHSSDCRIFVGRVRNDGAIYDDVGTVLTGNYNGPLHLININPDVRHRNNDSIEDSGHLKYSFLVTVLPIVCLVVALVNAIAIIMWLKRTSWKAQPARDPTCQSSCNLDSVSYTHEGILCDSDVMVKFGDSEKQKLEKMYREIDAKNQIDRPVGLPKTC